MIRSGCEVSGVLGCSREGKPPSHFQSQASLLTHKANYLLITVLKDTSVETGEAEQRAARLHDSSQPGLFLELFLPRRLRTPQTPAFSSRLPRCCSVALLQAAACSLTGTVNRRSPRSTWDYSYWWYETRLAKWRLVSTRVSKFRSENECRCRQCNVYNAGGCFYLRYLLR